MFIIRTVCSNLYMYDECSLILYGVSFPVCLGWDCGQIDSDGYWQILDSHTYGRASAAVIQQDEILWILDGYDFNANRNFSIIR